MKTSIEKFAIVRETSAALFEERLNEKLFELREANPGIEFDSVGDSMVARIRYTETVEKEEPRPSERGIRFTCGDCPMFEPERNSDGTVDRRKKWGGCPYALMERTFRDSEACDNLYIGIRNGDIGLKFKEVKK